MAKKKVGVKIEEALHAAVKSEAPNRKMLLEDAYEEALQSWLRGTLDPGSSTDKIPIDATAGLLHNKQVRAEFEAISQSLQDHAETLRALAVGPPGPGGGGGGDPLGHRKRRAG